MSFKVLTEHSLEFLSLKGACTDLSESTLVKMPHCWKSHVAAHISVFKKELTHCMLFCCLLDFSVFKVNYFSVKSGVRPNVLSGQIWVQTVFKSYHQITKVATSKQRIKEHAKMVLDGKRDILTDWKIRKNSIFLYT